MSLIKEIYLCLWIIAYYLEIYIFVHIHAQRAPAEAFRITGCAPYSPQQDGVYVATSEKLNGCLVYRCKRVGQDWALRRTAEGKWKITYYKHRTTLGASVCSHDTGVFHADDSSNWHVYDGKEWHRADVRLEAVWYIVTCQMLYYWLAYMMNVPCLSALRRSKHVETNTSKTKETLARDT